MEPYMEPFEQLERKEEHMNIKSLATLEPLEGKRSYLAALIMVILSGLKAQGFIDENTFQTLMGVAAALGLTFLRMAK